MLSCTMYFRQISIFLFGMICLTTYLWPKMPAPGLEEKEQTEITDHFSSVLSVQALATPPSKKGWRHAESKYFVFHYGNTNHLLRVYKEADFYLKAISKELQDDQFEPKYKFHIWIFINMEQWMIYSKKVEHDPHSAGFAPHNAREFFANFDLMGREGSNLFAHELTHALTFQIIGQQTPRWYSEGLAMYEEDRVYARYKKVAVTEKYMRINNRTIVDLSTLVAATNNFPESGYGGNASQLFYNHSELLVTLMVKEYGLSKVIDIGKLLNNNMTFEDAFKAITKEKDLETLKCKYQKEADKKIR